MHLAVDAWGPLRAITVTPANAQARAQVAELAAKIQETAGDSVEVTFVDPGCTGAEA